MIFFLPYDPDLHVYSASDIFVIQSTTGTDFFHYGSAADAAELIAFQLDSTKDFMMIYVDIPRT